MTEHLGELQSDRDRQLTFNVYSEQFSGALLSIDLPSANTLYLPSGFETLDRWVIRKRSSDNQGEPSQAKKSKTEPKDSAPSSNDGSALELTITNFESGDASQQFEKALLESLCIGLPTWEYLESLREFIRHCGQNQLWRPTSLRPIGDFLHVHGDWANHDSEIDSKWIQLCNRIVELSGGKIDMKTLVKPFGPLNAVLTTQWHFPTWFTQHPLYGMTMDDTNPSLRAQHAKFEYNDCVKSQDTYPIRVNFVRGGIKLDTIYENWSQIHEECLKFTRWLNRNSKIIFFVGEENVRHWRELVELDIDLMVFGEEPPTMWMDIYM
ncbi:hypothetical protein F53441_7961 [Fusarium austroafricanum]|uniref:Uncharacterized protein n=1 Tax=Fusarium austroafricanum TaxID=2364996 RepID=A0A8H4P578_9HYPO|nr:hypothetical protein F53441_7961 [Fusarium austroafricanum]